MNGRRLLPTFLKGPGWKDDTTITDLIRSSALKANREKSIVFSLPNLSKRFSTGTFRFSIQLTRKAFKTMVVGILKVSTPMLFTELMKINDVRIDIGIEKRKYAIVILTKI